MFGLDPFSCTSNRVFSSSPRACVAHRRRRRHRPPVRRTRRRPARPAGLADRPGLRRPRRSPSWCRPILLIAAGHGAARRRRALARGGGARDGGARAEDAAPHALRPIAALGPGTVGRQRSGALTLSLIDGVEQLETYFGQFLPQFLIALLSPLLIFAVVAFIDLPVALVMLGFALVALFAPGAVAQVRRQAIRCAGRSPMPPSPPSSSIRSRAWPR